MERSVMMKKEVVGEVFGPRLSRPKWIKKIARSNRDEVGLVDFGKAKSQERMPQNEPVARYYSLWLGAGYRGRMGK